MKNFVRKRPLSPLEKTSPEDVDEALPAGLRPVISAITPTLCAPRSGPAFTAHALTNP